MVNVAEKFTNAALNCAIIAPFAAASGALFGYVYAKFADLPAGQVAAAMAIWSIAEGSILILANSITENQAAQYLMEAAILTTCAAIGIHELQKRNLIGKKMVIFIVAMRVFAITSWLLRAADAAFDPLNALDI